MTHAIGTLGEWVTARKQLLEREKELTRQSDALARQRRALPWVAIEKVYEFETNEGTKTLGDVCSGQASEGVHVSVPDSTGGATAQQQLVPADAVVGRLWRLARNGDRDRIARDDVGLHGRHRGRGVRGSASATAIRGRAARAKGGAAEGRACRCVGNAARWKHQASGQVDLAHVDPAVDAEAD